MQKVVWTDDKGYWFLNILATHPDSQGRGIGGGLVRHVSKMVTHPTTNERLFQADENGLSCYLESSKFTPNVAIYERLGFRLVQEMTLNHDGDTCNVVISMKGANYLVVQYDSRSQRGSK